MTDAAESRLTLAPGARLVHIGLPKTGSSGTQGVAAALRPQLREHGVLYPGAPALLHTHPLMAFVRANSESAERRRIASSSGLADFDTLLREVRGARDQRVWLSSEDVAGADARAARALVEKLDDDGRMHAVITLRALGDRMISLWQQRIRNGRSTEPLEEWLGSFLPAEPGGRLNARGRNYLRFSDTVGRWVDLLGPERVTVIVADKTEPTRLYRTFEELLDLPTGLLELPEGDTVTRRSNRGLSPVEIEFARQVNLAAKEFGLAPRDYQRLIHEGSFARIQYLRRPGSDEGRLTVSAEAADRLVAAAEQGIAELEGSGLRIVGDLGSLAQRPPVGTMEPPAAVPIDAAALAVIGTVSRSLGRHGSAGAASDAPHRTSPGGVRGLGRRARQLGHAVRRRLGRG